MQKRSDLSGIQKGMIIGFRAKGGSNSETANFVNCSRASVVNPLRDRDVMVRPSVSEALSDRASQLGTGMIAKSR